MSQTKIIKIGSRRSKLAIIQSEHVQNMIEFAYPEYKCQIITSETLGDLDQSKPFQAFGNKALWTKELEDLLYEQDSDKNVDLIVHSLKDMPTNLPQGFELSAVTKRVDPSDCLVMPLDSPYTHLSDLPEGSTVGTSSVRRSAQLKRKYPHLKFEGVRGNIQTRLQKLDRKNSIYSCLVLATAGLVRLGLEHRITHRFASSTMCHAVGQGALGVETRTGDTHIKSILKTIADKNTTICCLAERALMRTLEGGCSVPIGVQSHFNHETSILSLKAIVVSVDGTEAVESSLKLKIHIEEEDSIKCGQLLAEKLISLGARRILDAIHQ